MEPNTDQALIPLVVGLVASLAMLGLAAWASRSILRSARETARRLLSESRLDAENKAKELLVAAQEKTLALEEEADRREREIEAREATVETRAREVETEAASIERRKRDLDRRQAAVARNEQSAGERLQAAEAEAENARKSLERTAGLTQEEARAELMAGIEEEARREAARLARRIEEEARARAERDALRLVVQATERVQVREAVETTVSFIELPSDEMKGRIIGREGRNIRALEMATGIDVVVDDTPRAILISSFDPIRREIARVAIERLIEDGRIHPARIEEVVAKVRGEIDEIVESSGSQAAFALGISDPHPRLARLVGRMKFRTHHGQSLLQHCTEVALVAGHMAAEVGARADIARRAGLLHEIGRVDEGATGHTSLSSAEIAGRYGEGPEVVQAIQALHPDSEASSLEAEILRIANRISENRPGARRDNLEVFLERLRRLEAIAAGFAGVTQAYAVKAGKEIRVLLDAKTTSDEDAHALAKKVARAIESDVSYSGQIKVTVIREMRAVHYAV